jgi:hypothetical protein
MFGRQQFPSSYTYDGTLCLFGKNHFEKKVISDPIPLILKDSSIVTDWIDYFYVTTK